MIKYLLAMDVRSEKKDEIRNYSKLYHLKIKLSRNLLSSIYDIALAVGTHLGLHVVNSEKDAKNS